MNLLDKNIYIKFKKKFQIILQFNRASSIFTEYHGYIKVT